MSPRPLNPVDSCGFGISVNVDDNLMVTADTLAYGRVLSPNAAYLFKRYGGKWVEFKTLSVETSRISTKKCIVVDGVSIAGDTVAVKASFPIEIPPPFTEACHIYLYKYDQENDSVISPPDILTGKRCGLMSLGENHLVHSADSGVLVYHRQDMNQPFELLQYFNSLDYGEGFGGASAMDKGISVAGGF